MKKTILFLVLLISCFLFNSESYSQTGYMVANNCTTLSPTAFKSICLHTGASITSPQILTQGKLYIFDGASWANVDTSNFPTFAQLTAITRADAVDPSTALKVGNGTIHWLIYCDSSNVCKLETDVTSDWVLGIDINKTFRLYDKETDLDILIVDPDAASKNAMYQFGANYQPLSTFEVPLTARPGTSVTVALVGIVTDQPGDYWATVTDANTDALDFNFYVTKRMEGATSATITLEGVSDNASPSGNIVFSCAMKSFRPGVDTYTSHSTTGEQTITLTPATQNRPVAATSSSITFNGTLAVGARMIGSCEVDATGTTSTQLTDFFLRASAVVQLNVNSISD